MRRGIALAFVVGAVLATAAPAHADHHFIKIREYYPGLAATSNDVFLELQMYAAGQNVLSGHQFWVYDSTDTPPEPSVHQLNPGPPLPNAQNQRSVLIGGSNVPGRDYPEEFQHDPAGGAICFVSTSGFGQIDCVEWGVGDPVVDAGNPAAPTGIPDGQSLNRSIAPGCATLLEDSDDTNDSATDFALGRRRRATTRPPRPRPTARAEGQGQGPAAVEAATPTRPRPRSPKHRTGRPRRRGRRSGSSRTRPGRSSCAGSTRAPSRAAHRRSRSESSPASTSSRCSRSTRRATRPESGEDKVQALAAGRIGCSPCAGVSQSP